MKAVVGRYAADLVTDGMVLGLGTGSTVRYLLEALGERLAKGDLTEIVGIPTSEDTRGRAERLGIRIGSLTDYPDLHLALDGADEVDPSLNLIKGLGGALLREKVVVTASRSFVVMVDSSKRVDRLGRQAPLPVEIDPFSLGIQIRFVEALGAEPRLRRAGDGAPFLTDGGNLILDCRFPDGIPDPSSVARALDSRPGVLEHGLFLGVAEKVLIGTPEGVEVVTRGD